MKILAQELMSCKVVYFEALINLGYQNTRNKNGLRMKVSYFKASYLTNYDRMLNSANFENRGNDIQRGHSAFAAG